MTQNDARRTTLIAAGAGIGLVVLSVLFLDRPIATWAHGLDRPVWCTWLTHIAELPVPASVIGLGAAGTAWLFGWRPGRTGRLWLGVCVATLLALAIKDVLKGAFGRTWPETWVMHNPSWIGTHTYGFYPFHGGPGWGSFPSGHTTATTAPCAALWRFAGRLRPVLVLLPALVVVGLIGSDFHFFGDCVAGALLGTACGVLVGSLLF